MSDSIHVRDYYDRVAVDRDLAFLQTNLSDAMQKQAGFFAYYSAVAADAQLQMDQFEQRQDLVAARLDQKVRDEAAANGQKLTEAQVKAKVMLEPPMIAVSMAVNKARKIAAQAKGAAEAFRHRRDMLIQSAFNDREERKGELRIHEEADRQQQGREARQQRLEAIHQKG